MDEPARRGKCVDAIGVEHDERPRQLRASRLVGQRRADERDVFVHRSVLGDAKAGADFQAHIGAELDLLFLGDVQLIELLLALLSLLYASSESAELSEDGAANGEQRDNGDPDFHACFSSTSKIATGLVLPFTTTSPSGRRTYRPGRAPRVA